jgi:AraC-like DNA-binding protein
VAEPGQSDHARYHPSPDLAPYIEHFWSVQWDRRGLEAQRVETLPHPSVHMIFERHVGGKISGVTRGKFSRVLENEGGVFAVKFTPGGFHPFLGEPVSTMTDTTASLHDVFGDEGTALARQVLAEPADASRIPLVEEFLRGRRPQPDENLTRVTAMVYAVAEDRRIVKVENLVDRYGVGTRTLQRLFVKYVGVSPKWVIQRYRLHEAAEQLAAGGSVSQSALALELGYSDQAHFVRDFKAMVGTTPAQYAARATETKRKRVRSERGGPGN